MYAEMFMCAPKQQNRKCSCLCTIHSDNPNTLHSVFYNLSNIFIVWAIIQTRDTEENTGAERIMGPN